MYIHDVVASLRQKDLDAAHLIDAIRFRLYLIEQRLSTLEGVPPPAPQHVSRETLVEEMTDALGTPPLFELQGETPEAKDDLGKGQQRGSRGGSRGSDRQRQRRDPAR